MYIYMYIWFFLTLLSRCPLFTTCLYYMSLLHCLFDPSLSLPLSLSQGRGKQAVVVPARQGEREPEAAKSRQSGQEILGVSPYLPPSP